MRPNVESRQVRAARALLDWNQTTLADAAGIAVMTVKRLEDEEQVVSDASIAAVVAALEEAGIAFLDKAGPGLGRGVALRLA